VTDEVVADRYRLERRLGTGGMAEVWAARDLELGRPVALKLLGPEADPQRFEREAHAAAALSHPNVTQLFDYGAWRGRPYMVLELVPGGTLEDRLRDARPLPDAETERIADEVAAGLAHAHSRGLVHRDLKPANVLFDADGRAKIADFGIARMGGAGTLTEAGTLLGTAAYVSPEQAAGEAATAASDVYSFGVMLFRMLTGRLPFEAEEPIELVRMHRDMPPPPVAAFRSDAPPQLAQIADACLAKDPHARPRDGRALVATLGGVPATAEAATAVLQRPPSPTAATRAAPPPRRPVRIRRNRLAALLLGLLVAAGAGLALAFLGHGSSSPGTTASTSHRTATRSTTTTTASTRTSTSTSSTTSTSTRSTTTRPTTNRPTTTRRTTTRPTTTRQTTTTPTTTEPTLTTTATTAETNTGTAPIP
jgi:eukaryotic-like serine/threonine-protein kinase